MAFGPVNIGGGAIKSIPSTEIDQITAGGAATTEGTYLDSTGLEYFEGKIRKAINLKDIIINASSTDGAAYTGTVDNLTVLQKGIHITIIPNKNSNAVIPTLDINGIGAKNIKQSLSINTSSTVPAANATWMVANKPVYLRYDGTQWVTVAPRSAADDIYGEVPVANGGTGATTAKDALTNLGAAARDLANTELTMMFNPATLPTATNWRSVTYGSGKFVAVAYNSNAAAYSTDGINWTAATLPSAVGYTSVTYGDGKFVAVAGSANGVDKAAYSTDGINWTAATLPSARDWRSVTYGNGKFVAVAYNSNVANYSTDGINWTAATLPSAVGYTSVTYGDGKFVAVAGSANGVDKAAYSTDGINWTAATLPSARDWRSVTYGNGKFVAVAYNSSAAAYSTDAPFIERLSSLGMARVQIGSYVGTGTFNVNNPNVLTFSFVPRFVCIMATDVSNMVGFAVYGSGYMLVLGSGSLSVISWVENSIQWYGSNSASRQLNSSGVTYQYIAIG